MACNPFVRRLVRPRREPNLGLFPRRSRVKLEKLGKPKAISQQFMVRQVNASAGYNGCFASFFRSPRSVNDKLLSLSQLVLSNQTIRWIIWLAFTLHDEEFRGRDIFRKYRLTLLIFRGRMHRLRCLPCLWANRIQRERIATWPWLRHFEQRQLLGNEKVEDEKKPTTVRNGAINRKKRFGKKGRTLEARNFARKIISGRMAVNSVNIFSF